jgi:hypothetical protein
MRHPEARNIGSGDDLGWERARIKQGAGQPRPGIAAEAVFRGNIDATVLPQPPAMPHIDAASLIPARERG